MKSSRRMRRLIPQALAVSAAAALVLTGCSSGNGGDKGNGGSGGGKSFTVLSAAENPSFRKALKSLAQNECKAENKAMPLDSQTVAQSNVVQKITLLASQKALPDMFIAGTSQVKPDGDLGKNKLIVDLEKKLKDEGVWDDILPGAASTVKNVYGGWMASLPFQFNIEGIFYNKKIFADSGIEEPKTWDALMSAAKKLKGAGIVPITEAGAEGWPITRLIGNYIFRSLGPDALKKVQEGKAKLTDPGYVKAAAEIAQMGADGLFGPGITSRDTDTAHAQFLNGQAAMTYDGSWLLSNINDPEQDKVGVENIGFMPFPAVEGGKGSIDQYPANAGAATAISSAGYGPKTGDWLKCIAENWGSHVMKEQAAISGFKLNTPVSDIPPLTKDLHDKITKTDKTVLWFEARFNAKASSDAATNVAPLLTGSMSPENYMKALQADLDQG